MIRILAAVTDRFTRSIKFKRSECIVNISPTHSVYIKFPALVSYVICTEATMILARQFHPRVRYAISFKGASKLRTLLLSRTLWDKSAGSGHDVYDHSDSTVAKAVCATPADPPQRLDTGMLVIVCAYVLLPP